MKRGIWTRPTGREPPRWAGIFHGYSFATSQRYLSLYHEVAPKENALQCADCHVSTGRLNFKALGYQVKATRKRKPLCASCHDVREPLIFTKPIANMLMGRA